MAKNRRIEVRLTSAQYERIVNLKEALGYSSLANMVREKLLRHSLSSDEKITKIYHAIVKDSGGKHGKHTPSFGKMSAPTVDKKIK